MEVSYSFFVHNAKQIMKKKIKYHSFSKYLEDFDQLLVVFNHQNISFTIISNILAGLWRVGGVDASGQSPVTKREICVFTRLLYLILHSIVTYSIRDEQSIPC